MLMCCLDQLWANTELTYDYTLTEDDGGGTKREQQSAKITRPRHI